ncbi:MAG: xanthine phosphoribosyltransferase [Christensenellales bacterium]
MDALKRRILANGRALNEQVLLVDSFLNHQVDPALMREIGAEFAARFQDAGIDIILTIESSGIAPAVLCAEAMGLSMVILKKQTSRILQAGVIQTEVHSYTKNTSYQLTVKSEFIKKGARALIIDDFLANGEAAFGAIRLIEQAGGAVAGIGIVIAKAFQPGLQRLRAAGYRVEALAPIARMRAGDIEFI